MTDVSRREIGSDGAGAVESMEVTSPPGCTVVMSLSLGSRSVGISCEPKNDMSHSKVRKHKNMKRYLLTPTIDYEWSPLQVALLRGHWWAGSKEQRPVSRLKIPLGEPLTSSLM